MSKEEKCTGVCGICGGNCLVDVTIQDGKIEHVEGNTTFPGSSGKLCVKGAALKQYIHNPERLLYPMKRTGERGSDAFERISWEEALDQIAEKMLETKREHSADETFVYVGHPKWFRGALQDFAEKYGTCNYGTESSTCAYALCMAFHSVYGINAFPAPDVKNTDTLVLWGVNPAYSNTPRIAGIQKAKEAGKKLIAVDPRCTPTTELADLHLRPWPGTDGALALGLAHVMIREELYDAAFVASECDGFEEYKEYVLTYFAPEQVETITSVPAEQIREAARWMTQGKCALQMSASPVVHNINGFQNARAVLLLMALTGNYGKEGGIMAPGPAPLRLNGDFGPGKNGFSRVEDCLSHEKYPLWSAYLRETQSVDLVDYLEGKGKNPVRNLISFGMNHHMWPRPDLLEQSFDNLELFVCVDAFMTETARYADLVLPCALPMEMEQVLLLPGANVLHRDKILHHGELLSDVEILMELSSRLGFELGDPAYHNMEEYLNYRLKTTGLTLEDFKMEGDLLKVRTGNMGQGPATGKKKGYPTPSGKIQFLCDLITGEEKLPVYHDYREQLPMEEYPFVMAAGCRKPQLFHSRTYRMHWMTNLEPFVLLDIHPEDAEKLGIEDKEEVRVTTPVGSMDLIAHFDSGMHPGMVNIYHGAGKQDINYLLDKEYVDPISGFPGYKSYCCKIEKKGKEYE